MIYNAIVANLESEQKARGNIESADIGDLGKIENLNRQLHINLPNFIWDRGDWILQEIKNGNFFVLRQEGAICGAICLIPHEDELVIETLAVDKSEQGKGVGRKLVEFALDTARSRKVSRVSVESFLFYGVKDFYQKCGFEFDLSPIDIFEGAPYFRFVKNT